MLKQSGIYQIRNTVNGKRYVGSAKCFKVRQSRHWSALSLGNHHARHLQSAFKKYGAGAFVFEPLLVCTQEDLLFYEQRAIDRIKPEYNSSPTAGNTMGVKCSPERRRKISEAHMGKKLSEEHKRKIAPFGRIPTAETRVKLSAAAQRRAADPEWQRKHKEGCATRVFPADFGERIRRAKTGVPVKTSEEGKRRRRKALIEYNKTRPITEEFRANMRAAQRVRINVERFLHNNKLRTVLDLAEEFNIDRHVLRKRLNAGWGVDKAVTTPVRGKKNNE